MVLTKILERNAAEFPAAPALTMKMGFRTVHMSYKDVYDVSRQFALLLEKNGVQKGDRVLLLAPNSPYWICAFWGCLLRGAVAVPLNVQSTHELVEKIAKQTDANVFFAHRFYKYDLPGIPRYDIDAMSDELQKFDPEQCKAVAATDADLVEILYTSGTTGDPKGVMLTHKNLYANIAAVSKMVFLKKGKERLLSILPLSHIFEQAGGFLLAQQYVAHVIYAHSHAAIRDLMKQYHVTKMMAVPEFLKIIMSKVEARVAERGKTKLFNKLIDISLKLNNKCISRLLFHKFHKQFGGKLDTIVCGGAPLDPELERKWNAVGIFLMQGYGLTETSPLVTSNTYKYHRFASVGKPAPGVTVRIADTGEIEVKGDNVFQGYYRDEARTKEVFTSDGFFKTGDMGELDKDGYLFLKGREKYMILGPGGQNVFPEDIEEVLNAFPSVKDSAVVGLEMPGGMVEIHAVLLLESDHAQEIIEEANKKLASYQQIGGMTVWPDVDFPRSATKKVKKEEVIKFLKEKEDGEVCVTRATPLIALLSQVTGVPTGRITQDTTLQKLHVDSLMRVELVAMVEETFNVTLDETKLVASCTVAQLQEMIDKHEPVKTLAPLRKWPRWRVTTLLRSVGQFLVYLLMRIFVKFRVKGYENIPKGLVIFMPNHLSYFDGAFLISVLPNGVGKRTAFAAANDVLYRDYWWFVPAAEFLYNTFPFPRKEGENIKLGLDYMGRLLDDGFPIAVFPEGKISENGKLLPLKKGAGLIAVEMGVPVVPVLIEGSEKIFPYDKFLPRRRGTVSITFGKPMRFKKTESYEKATEAIEAALRRLSSSSSQ